MNIFVSYDTLKCLGNLKKIGLLVPLYSTQYWISKHSSTYLTFKPLFQVFHLGIVPHISG